MSRRLPWLVEPDSEGSSSGSTRTSFQKLGQESWFSATTQRLRTPSASSQSTSYLPSPCLWQGIAGYERQRAEYEEGKKQTKTRRRSSGESRAKCQKTSGKQAKKGKEKEPAGKARKVKVYPTPEQKKTLLRWFGTARWTYNACLEAIEKEGTKKRKKELRAKCLNAAAFADKPDLRWVLETPYDVRDEAMNDLLKAYKTCFSVGKPFKMKCRKQETQSIAILATHWNRKGGEYSKLFGPKIMRSTEGLPDVLGYDSRLIMTRLGEFYMCIPLPLKVQGDNQAPDLSQHTQGDPLLAGVIALDPGVRTFMTGYDPSGKTVEWGKADMGRIDRLCHFLDDLHSRWGQKEVRHRKRYRLKKAARRMRKKIRNLVDECHRKLSRWLVENYRVVLIPSFRTSEMVRRGQRRIRSKTARAMCTWAHYRFRTRLLDQAREFPWCRVIEVREDYTSKTCGRCGHIHQRLGGSKVFRCPACGFELDRDLNGARNILLRYLTESGVSV